MFHSMKVLLKEIQQSSIYHEFLTSHHTSTDTNILIVVFQSKKCRSDLDGSSKIRGDLQPVSRISDTLTFFSRSTPDFNDRVRMSF